MCECHKQKFQSEGHKYVKKSFIFTASAKILFCKDFPFGADVSSNMEERKSSCASCFSHGVFQFCCNGRYLLHFKCTEICMERIPVNLHDKIVTTYQYFKHIDCQPFFGHNKKSNAIEIYLDNLSEPRVPLKLTRSIFLLRSQVKI